MSVLIEGMDKPIACIECVFLSKPEEIYVGNDRYEKIRRCVFVESEELDSYRKESWFVNNVEPLCPIKEVVEVES